MVDRPLRRFGPVLKTAAAVGDAEAERGPDVHETGVVGCLLEQRQSRAGEYFELVDVLFARKVRRYNTGKCGAGDVTGGVCALCHCLGDRDALPRVLPCERLS